MKLIDEYFATARERYRIMLKRRKGLRPPWTTDAVLAKYRFCNVFREDDKQTAWIRENLRVPLTGTPLLVPAMAAARFINKAETLEAIKHILLVEGWNGKKIRPILKAIMKSGKPILSAAYMIKTPEGKDKPDGLDEILKPIQRYRHPSPGSPGFDTIKSFYDYLKDEFHYVGSFIAYEIATDVGMAFDAKDRNAWAAAGPGAARGLSRVVYGEIGHFDYARHQVEMLEVMIRLLEASRKKKYWNPAWPRWDMRTVEHWSCEADKVFRTRSGESEPKQLYHYPE